MIASEATAAMGLPLRDFIDYQDVTYRTHLLASPARNTFRSINTEVLVRHEEAVEQGTNDVGLCPWERSALQFSNLLTFFNASRNFLYRKFFLCELLFTLLFAIDIEAWQADINIGHQHRESRIELPS